MSLRVSNIRLRVDEPEALLGARLARILGLPGAPPTSWRILRKSLDARDKDRLQFVYSVEVRTPEDEGRMVQLARRRLTRDVRIEPYAERPFVLPARGSRPLEQRPIVIGSGPAGLVAAYFLAEQGYRSAAPGAWPALSATASATCMPSTRAAVSIRRAITSSARAGPARSATAS